MKHQVARREVVRQGLILGVTGAAALRAIGQPASGTAPTYTSTTTPTSGAQANSPPAVETGKNAWPGFPQQDPALVKEMVGASHGNVERVTQLLASHPELAKCAYDWSFGDWETALGAASHVGNRTIAQMLLDHGARLDIFAATMLGMTDAVKAMLAAQPSLARTRGPHGISLLAHAVNGKSDELAAYLKTVDGAGDEARTPLTDEELKVYLGTYSRDSAGGGGELAVSRNKFGMVVKFQNGPDRLLYRTGQHTFHPAGAPGVRVTFTVSGASAVRIELVEDDWFVSAVRNG